MPALADTTVLSNFAQAGRPDLLRAAYPDLAAPEPTFAELRRGARLGLVPPWDGAWLPVVEPTAAERAHAEELGRRLGAGEAACLAIARSRGWLLLSDDGDARDEARALGLEVSGTLGTLVRLVDRRILDIEEADALHAAMVRRGYRSPVRSLREVLAAPPER